MPNKHTVKSSLKTYGPAIIHIDASDKTFRFYKSGNFHNISLKNKYIVNHCALLVGYDHIIKKGSWIVQNRY